MVSLECLTRELLAKYSCLHPVLTLHIPVMCRAYASFHKMLSRELPVKTLQSSICLSLHTHTLSLSLSLSYTQPLQLNPTINTGYKRLNKITIKFGTELKPTKHIVINYNFTCFVLFCFLFFLFLFLFLFFFFVFLFFCFFKDGTTGDEEDNSVNNTWEVENSLEGNSKED